MRADNIYSVRLIRLESLRTTNLLVFNYCATLIKTSLNYLLCRHLALSFEVEVYLYSAKITWHNCYHHKQVLQSMAPTLVTQEKNLKNRKSFKHHMRDFDGIFTCVACFRGCFCHKCDENFFFRRTISCWLTVICESRVLPVLQHRDPVHFCPIFIKNVIQNISQSQW